MKQQASLKRITIATFIALVPFGMMVPMLPLFTRQFSSAGTAVGLVFALNQAVDFFFAPVVGRLSDRIGRRGLLIGAMVLTAIAYAAVGMAPSLTALLVIWALAGFGSSQVLLTQAYIADVTSGAERTRGMGYWGAAFATGFVVGPPLGAALFAIDPRLAAVVAAALALAATGYVLLFVAEPGRHSEQASRTVDPQRMRLLRSIVLAIIALYFVVIFVWSSFTTVLAIFGEDELGWTVRRYGAFLGFVGLVAAILQGRGIGPLAARYGRRPLVITGFVLLGAGLVGLSTVPGPALLYTSGLGIALGFGLLMPTLPAMLSLEVLPERRGTALGLFQSASTGARVLAPLAAGALYDYTGHGSPFFAVGLAAIVTGLATAIALRGRPRSSSSSL